MRVAGNSPFGAAILANKQGYPLLHADANQVNNKPPLMPVFSPQCQANNNI